MKTTAEENKALVLKAFDTLFNKRDYEAAASFWSENYIQHSSHIEPGRDGLFNLVRSLPDTLRYENAVIVADGDYVILHGRFSGNGQPAALIAADIVRMEYGRLAEHWDAMDSGQSQPSRPSTSSSLVLAFTDSGSSIGCATHPAQRSRKFTRSWATS
jgi:predicted SnoaL-like aldol condensation-catalyzing enzyme